MTFRVEGATNEPMTPLASSGGGAKSFEELVTNPAGFRLWYDDALPRVYRYLLARCGDESLAEELTQEAFVEAVRSRRRFDGRSDPVTWICAIGRNRLADHVRRDHRDARRHLRLVGEFSEHEGRAWRDSDIREDVERALGALSAQQRFVLMLRYLDDMHVRQISALLRRSESATESLLGRAREGFRRAYEGHTDE